jgi:cyclic pyranopterin phosphate synthase
MDKPTLTHVNRTGEVRMVDMLGKDPSSRLARAEAFIRLGPTIARLLRKTGAVAKGNVLETARIAGIMAAKRTHELIPLCHPLPLDGIHLDFALKADTLRIESTVTCRAPTGVEMEALTAASLAALTVYDMCKSAGKGMVIGPVRLLEKSGGKSGHWRAKETPDER